MKGNSLTYKAVQALAVIALAASPFLVTGCSSCSSQKPQEAQQEATADASTDEKKSEQEKMADVDKDAELTVPNVISLTQIDAQKAITASGMRVGNITMQSSDTVPYGAVISQDPAALSKAKANSTVNIVISTGKAKAQDVKVPT